MVILIKTQDILLSFQVKYKKCQFYNNKISVYYMKIWRMNEIYFDIFRIGFLCKVF